MQQQMKSIAFTFGQFSIPVYRREQVAKRSDLMKTIHRIKTGKMAEGVCGGIARYFGIDVSIVRFIWLLLCLAGGIGIWLYLICTIAMPKEPN